jgi:hypothetical protein
MSKKKVAWKVSGSWYAIFKDEKDGVAADTNVSRREGATWDMLIAKVDPEHIAKHGDVLQFEYMAHYVEAGKSLRLIEETISRPG